VTHVNVYFQKQAEVEHKNEREQEEVCATKLCCFCLRPQQL